MGDRQLIEADLIWTGDRFEGGLQVAIESGRVVELGPWLGEPTRTMTGRALLPGMVNTHSHAFQRALRGHGERFEAAAGSFWTWRTAMYELVESMDETQIYELSRRAFAEMLAAGITTVGEFHYLHHDAEGAGYALDEAVLRAAADAGIRIALLAVYYRAGGFGQPPGPAQERFVSASPEAFWAQLDRLSDSIDDVTQSLGVSAHSLRAVPVDELVTLHRAASQRDLVFHMHLEEQPREIEDCLAFCGMRPLAVVNERLGVDDRFTAVHCTHSIPEDLETFLAAGGHVCVCPLTEANLGDGIPDGCVLKQHGDRVCLGTDSNTRISFTEEMRWLEYTQRLRTISRGVYVDEGGHSARELWRMATTNGARALGVACGEISEGSLADLVAIDLEAPELAGWTEETLLDAFVFGTGAEAIREVCVAGRWT